MNYTTPGDAMISHAPHRFASFRGQPATKSTTICIVDAQPSDYDDFAQTAGVKVQFAPNAAEALRLCRTNRIDLWVVSASLPDLSGLELCGMLKSNSATAAVWFVADEYSADVERAALANRATLFCCRGTHTQWLSDWFATHSTPNNLGR